MGKTFRFVNAQQRLRFPTSKVELSYNGFHLDTYTVRSSVFDRNGILTSRISYNVKGEVVRNVIDMDVAETRQMADNMIGQFISLRDGAIRRIACR